MRWLVCLCVAVGLMACGSPASPAETPPATPTPVPAEPTATATVPAEDPPPTATPSPEADLSGNPDLDFAQVQFVTARETGDNVWRFDVTVRHNDEGWDHYADLWQVVSPDGAVLAERVLAHPHDNEQPFTRSQTNIQIPADMSEVIVRAKCNVHGFGGQEVLVDLTVSEGEHFEVVR